MTRTTVSFTALALLAMMGVVLMGCGDATHADEGNMTGRLDHPCALVNPEMVESLREKAADTTENRFGFSTAEVWQELLADADRFLNAAPYHYSVNIQQDPTRDPVMWEYTLSDETPPRHPGINYPPWTAMTQEARDDAITVRLKSLSFAYLVTGERRYADAAKEIALHLANWEWWSDPDYGRGIACLDTGHITKCMGLFYDWCHDTLSSAQRRQIRQAIAEKGCEKILEGIDGYPPETNGWAVLTSGLAVAGIAIRPDDPRGGLYVERAIEFTRRSLDLSGEDGGQFEGPMYGTYLLDSLAHVFDAMSAADVENDLLEHPFMATMEEYVISQMTPDSHEMPCFGDGSPGRCYPETMSVLANNGSEAAAWYLEQIGFLRPKTIHQFIRFDPNALRPRQPDFQPSRALVDVGLASLKAGYEPHTPYLCIKAGPPETSVGHAHFDSNAIVLSFLGDWLISDRGYRARHDPPAQKFSQGSMGHATMVMDIDDGYLYETQVPHLGHDQVNRAGARIEEFFASDAIDYVRGEAAPTYNNDQAHVLDSFARQIFYLKPDLYVMIDDIWAPEPHTYNITLHPPTNGALEQIEGDNWAIVGPNARLNCFLFSPGGLMTESMVFPGAERYGQFLRARSAETTDARFVTLMYPEVSESGGVLANPGFELGMVGWRPRANEDLPNHVIDEEVAHSGQSSGRIDNSGYYYSGKIQVEPGDTVTATAWMRTGDLVDGTPRLVIHWWDTSGDCFATEALEAEPSADWTQLEVSGVAPEGAVTADIGLYFSGEGSVWWDDVTLESDAEREKIVRDPISNVTPLVGGERGITATVGDRELAVITSGDAIEVNGRSVEHDGSFAAICMVDGRWRSLYLQEGTRLSIDGETVLATGTEDPITLVVWREDDGEVHAQAQSSLEPHAPAIPAAEIRLGVRSDAPIEGILVGGERLPVEEADGLWTVR